MRIGILTFHRADNCGAMLQAWALKRSIERMGHSVVFLPRVTQGLKPCYRQFRFYRNPIRLIKTFVGTLLYNLFAIRAGGVAYRRYCEFLEKYLPEAGEASKVDRSVCDCVVFGSDQIWNIPLVKDEGDVRVYLGERVEPDIPCISYAASIGDCSLPEKDLRRLGNALKRFSAVSVRETLAQEQLRKVTSLPVALVLDPTLLLVAEDYRAVMDDIRLPGDFLYVYQVSGGEALVRRSREIARELGIRPIITSVYQKSRWRAPRGLTYGISPGRLLAYASHARCVIAGSFHGTVFALQFKRPFVSYRPIDDSSGSRPATLLNELGLQNRLVYPDTPTAELLCLLKTALPEHVYGSRLADLRRYSLEWLNDSLNEFFEHSSANSAVETVN